MLTDWGERLRVLKVKERHPGRGIRGRGTIVDWNDDTGTVYEPGRMVTLVGRDSPGGEGESDLASQIEGAVAAIKGLRARAVRTRCDYVVVMCDRALGRRLSKPPTEAEEADMIAALKECRLYV